MTWNHGHNAFISVSRVTDRSPAGLRQVGGEQLQTVASTGEGFQLLRVARRIADRGVHRMACISIAISMLSIGWAGCFALTIQVT